MHMQLRRGRREDNNTPCTAPTAPSSERRGGPNSMAAATLGPIISASLRVEGRLLCAGAVGSPGR
eukprot:CAMPEP_0170387550 /NCGR_PEP_ID=MMETSP0117_2-20130122/17617_1 /TAXON_ID=400756 /ORGANISM="Durinskia baltica, Strain CSIRO CS-38" /LENGTH=64 /DNA_ID=CAMNT_0010643425 /DNA_START=218 /DNA_END=409 /DNA_ORIENTATION=+